MVFTDEQLERYSRHIILKEVGVKGQKKFMEGRVLIIGAGGLGSPAAMYLAAAGVGTIGIAGADVVDLSNLQRQIIHLGMDGLLSGCLLTYNALTMDFRRIQLARDPTCRVCGETPAITTLIDYEQAVCDLKAFHNN